MEVEDSIVVFYRARGKPLGSLLGFLRAQLTLISIRPCCPMGEMEEGTGIIL